MIGRTIGKYRILAPLGRGATGIVYKALDQTLERDVAIKVLNPDAANDEIMRRFRAEATTLAKLNHPDIATIYELIEVDADLLMVMELVRGETLERLSDRLGPMAPESAACVIDRILSALEHAHRAGIVHRDIKPANIMVTGAGGVKIMDFGIARVRGLERMTLDGGMMGTPAYMPPEQVLGKEVDGRTDLYSVGVVLYRLLTSALPFTADNAIAVLQKQIADRPTPLLQHRDSLPDWCDTIVQRALAKSPADRFQTAEAFREALGRATGLSSGIDLAKAFPLASEGDIGSPHTPAVQTVELLALDDPPAISEAATVVLPRPGAPRTTSPGARRSRAEPIVDNARIVLRKTYFAWSRWGLAAAAGVALLGYLGWSRNASQSITAAPPKTIAAAPVETVASAAEAVTAAPARTFPVVVFDAKTVVGSGAEQRERDARFVLADGNAIVTLRENGRQPLHAMSYDDVSSINYSRGREPHWRSPTGVVRVVRIREGFFDKIGISVEKHWISLRTNGGTKNGSRFIVLQVNEAAVGPILAALEERTGRTPRVIGRR